MLPSFDSLMSPGPSNLGLPWLVELTIGPHGFLVRQGPVVGLTMTTGDDI